MTAEASHSTQQCLQRWAIAAVSLKCLLHDSYRPMLPTAGAALKAVAVYVTKEQHAGSIIHVISHHGFQANQALIQVVQAARDAGLVIGFNQLSVQPVRDGAICTHDSMQAANQQASWTSFHSQMAAYENVYMQLVDADALGMDVMLGRWWQQAYQLVQRYKSNSSQPSGARHLPATKLLLQLPASAPAGLPGAHYCDNIATITCSVASQMLHWDTSVQMQEDIQKLASKNSASTDDGSSSSSTTGTFLLGGQHVLHPTPAAKQQLLTTIQLCQQGCMRLEVLKSVQASMINQALVYGQGYILQPSCMDDTTLDPTSTAPPSAVFTAMCQVLHAREQVLVASSTAQLQDDGRALASVVQQLYCLMPCPSPPSLLIRKLACREQVVPVADSTLGMEALDDHQQAAAQAIATQLVDELSSIATQTEDVYAGCFGSGCHAHVAQLLGA